jgi:hypothetical protein
MVGRFSFCICWAATEQKLIQAEQKTFDFFCCWTEEHDEPCCMVVCRTKQGRPKYMCKKTRETWARLGGWGVFSVRLSLAVSITQSAWPLCCKKSHH